MTGAFQPEQPARYLPVQPGFCHHGEPEEDDAMERELTAVSGQT